MAALGAKGGATTGLSKVRGTREYYRDIGRKGARARKRMAAQALTK